MGYFVFLQFLHDIRLLALKWNIVFLFVSRSWNRAAHWLASQAISLQCAGNWVGCPHPILFSLVASAG